MSLTKCPSEMILRHIVLNRIPSVVIRWDSSVGIRRNLLVGSDTPLLPISSFNKLLSGANFKGPSKPTDRFCRITTLGSYWIPTLRIRLSVNNSESDRILWPGLYNFFILTNDFIIYFWCTTKKESSCNKDSTLIFLLWKRSYNSLIRPSAILDWVFFHVVAFQNLCEKLNREQLTLHFELNR
jgi:hypothetical protein